MSRRLRGGVIIGAIAASLVAMIAHASLPDEVLYAKVPIFKQAQDAFWRGDIDALERLYAQARTTRTVSDWEGLTEGQHVINGALRVFSYDNLDDAYFREVELLTERWALARPDDFLSQMLYVMALYEHAWHVRGNGYWQAVPELAKNEFMRLIAKAEKHIAGHAALLMKDNPRYDLLLRVGRLAGWSPAQLRAVAEYGLSHSAEDEELIYSELVTALLPKWGGSFDRVADLTEEIDARTRDARGHELYATSWDAAADDVSGNLFEKTRANWPRIKQGFESLVAHRAHPYYANRFAYLACLAKDPAAMKAALAKLGDPPDADDWRGGGSGGRENFEACMRWLNSEQSDPAAPEQEGRRKGRGGGAGEPPAKVPQT